MSSTLVAEYRLSETCRLQIAVGDLTQEPLDAIVNAANSHLQHGGGVAGAIARQGGRQIQAESDAWVAAHGPVPHDRPAVTGAGKLPCRYVIHAVGPVWGSGDEDRKLAACVRGALDAANQMGLETIALPAISTGIFGFPLPRAAAVILSTIQAVCAVQPGASLRLVRVVLLDQATAQVFVQAWKTISPPGAAPAAPA